jgi:uncharacterized membrane protein YozB (DUF420 family)
VILMVTPIASTISLVIQIVVLALLIGAYMLKRHNKFRQHGIIMLSAVVLHIISILAVMIPSFALFFAEPILINFADSLVIVTLVHVVAGVVAALLGIWLVGSWHLKKDITPCFKKKRIMDATIILWLLAIGLGIILYMAIVQSS